MNLVEQARKHVEEVGKKGPKNMFPYSMERLELALAYAEKEVTGRQVSLTLGISAERVYVWCARIILEGIRVGDLKVRMVRKKGEENGREPNTEDSNN